MRRVAALWLVLVLPMACAESPGSQQPASVPDTMEGSMPDTEPDVIPWPDAPTHVEGLIDGRLCPTESTADYDNTGGPFLLNWCTGCHSSLLPAGQRGGAPLGVDFDTPTGIEEHLLRIYARSADHNVTMPPVDAVPTYERNRVGDWITCGAPGLEEAVILALEPAEEPGPGDSTPGNGGAITNCSDDSDCEGQCPGSKTGCVCVQKNQGLVCARPCTTAADCPKKGNFACADGVCAKKNEG